MLLFDVLPHPSSEPQKHWPKSEVVGFTRPQSHSKGVQRVSEYTLMEAGAWILQLLLVGADCHTAEGSESWRVSLGCGFRLSSNQEGAFGARMVKCQNCGAFWDAPNIADRIILRTQTGIASLSTHCIGLRFLNRHPT